MSFNLQKTKVTALPDSSGWVEVYDGNQFVLLVSTKKDKSNVSDLLIVRNFFKKIQEYFETLPLRDSIKKSIQEFEPLLGEIQISAIAKGDTDVQTVAVNGGEVYVYRQGVMASILKSTTSDLISAKGSPQDQDIIILGTNQFFVEFDHITLKSAIEKGGPVGAATEFETRFEEKNISGAVGAYFVKFINDEKQSTQYKVQEQEQVKPLDNVKNFKSSFQNLKSKLFSFIPDRQIFVRNIEFNPVEEQSKKTTMSAGLILLAILFISILFGMKQKNINNQKSKYEGKLTEAQHMLDEAVGLTGVSGERSRELFGQSEIKLKEIQELKIKDERIDALAKQIADKRGEILGEYAIEPALYLDLTLLSSGFKAEMLAVTGETVFLLDGSSKKLISIEIPNKKSKVVAGPDKITKVDGLAAYDDRAFILNDEGIIEIGNETRVVLAKDWETTPLAHSFAGNMYLLAKDSNSIYRYSGKSDLTFGSRYDWLSTSVTADFSNVKSWTMDGSIYVLTSTNKIAKFSRGSTQGFAIKGVYPELIEIEAIYANEDNEYFYVLDKEGKRVVVLTKSGEYKAQYVADRIGEAKNIVVAESQKKILILTGEKIYTIETKH